MNVEASHHSPSVTVSIFDALAEILTSTPRPRLSTTTEVSQKQYTTNDVIQTLNGVSNYINVNSVSGSSSQDTLTTTAGINTNAKIVQNTDQNTPIVINRLSVGEGVKSSVNSGEQTVDSMNTVQLVPTPSPTTPVSARRPFAIKVLYSDTEPPVDRFTTATETASVQQSTDSPMVYNTVSDLLLSNNNLVSSELTSMLSNNIKSILEQMDESSRSRISLDMAELLKTLIPRAIDGLATDINDADSTPNTTPYSLEDIKDTENIFVNNDNNLDIASFNNLQTVTPDSNVHSTVNVGTVVSKNDVDQAVNSVGTIPQTSSTVPVFTDQMTITESMKTTLNNMQITTEPTSHESLSSSDVVTLTFSDQFSTGTVTEGNPSTASASAPISSNSFPAIPFLTNFRAGDFIVNNESLNVEANKNISSPTPLSPDSSSSGVDNLELDDPNQVSRFQLYVLSKKARVLKMIEDLIRQHNDELATVPPLTELIGQSNNIPLSNRLTKIINTMSSTTEATNTNDDDFNTPMTTPFNLATLSTTSESSTLNGPINSKSGDEDRISLISKITPDDGTSTPTASNIFVRLGEAATTASAVTEASLSDFSIETMGQSLVTLINQFEDITTATSTSGTEGISTQSNIATSTISQSAETTTQLNSDITIDDGTETTTQLDVTTLALVNETKQNIVTGVKEQVTTAAQPSIPKKDYVIFGILPNNTVVRKDPNDDILETLTEASPYIVYGVLPNNTVIRKFPNGTRVPRVMQKIDILPISPWSLRNPYSPIHNNPAIVRPQSNPIRVSTNTVTPTDTNNGTESRLTNDTVNNLQMMVLTLRCLA